MNKIVEDKWVTIIGCLPVHSKYGYCSFAFNVFEFAFGF